MRSEGVAVETKGKAAAETGSKAPFGIRGEAAVERRSEA